MYTCSEDAIEANESVSLKAAAAELKRHGARIICGPQVGETHGIESKGKPWQIQVTNDCDEPEWIDCTTKGILVYLGY